MAGPWEKYQAPAAATAAPAGPWSKYSAPAPAAPAGREQMAIQPNLSLLPQPFGALASMAGYDGQPHPSSSMVPALDPINAAATKGVESIPFVGKKLAGLGNEVDAAAASVIEGKPVTPEQRQAINEADQAHYPVASAAGEIAGNVGPFELVGAPKLVATALGKAGGALSRAAAAGVTSGLAGGGDALTRGATPLEALKTGAIDAGVGAAIPTGARAAGVAWDGVKKLLSSAANAGVDRTASSEVGQLAQQFFQNSEAAGVAVNADAYNRFVGDVSGSLKKLRMNSTLDPKATAALAELKSAGSEIGADGSISLGDLHNLRQIAQTAAQSREGRDRALGTVMVQKLDDFMGGLRPADIAGASDPVDAVLSLKAGISTWHQARKAGLIEDAMYRAGNAASGYENGLRNEFRAILNNPQKRQGFTPPELKALADVVQGTPGANLTKLLGKFGFGGGNASNMLGGAVGAGLGTAAGGPVGGFVAGAGAAGARAASQAMTGKAAQRALEIVSDVKSTPNMKANAMKFLRYLNAGGAEVPAPAGVALLADQSRDNRQVPVTVNAVPAR